MTRNMAASDPQLAVHDLSTFLNTTIFWRCGPVVRTSGCLPEDGDSISPFVANDSIAQSVEQAAVNRWIEVQFLVESPFYF